MRVMPMHPHTHLRLAHLDPAVLGLVGLGQHAPRPRAGGALATHCVRVVGGVVCVSSGSQPRCMPALTQMSTVATVVFAPHQPKLALADVAPYTLVLAKVATSVILRSQRLFGW